MCRLGALAVSPKSFAFVVCEFVQSFLYWHRLKDGCVHRVNSNWNGGANSIGAGVDD
jgi:hypothetical protein